MSTSSSNTKIIINQGGGYTLLMDLCRTNNIEAVRVLLEGDFDIDERCRHYSNAKKTALHFACEAGFHEIAELLLMNEANPTVKDRQLNTPLHLAKEAKIVSLLLEHGADPKAMNKKGKTPEQIARDEGNAAVLAAYEAHAKQKTDAENRARHREKLLTYIHEQYSNRQKLKTTRSELKKKLVEKTLSYIANQDHFDNLFQHPIPLESLDLSDDERNLFCSVGKQTNTTVAEVLEFHRNPIIAKTTQFFGTRTLGFQTLLMICDVDTMNREALQFLNQLIKRFGTPKAGSKTEAKQQALINLRDHLTLHPAESLLALCNTRVESHAQTLLSTLSFHRRSDQGSRKITRSRKEFCQKFGLPTELASEASQEFKKPSTS
jgi:Ankyrin repeats (3 copies)/Ankyrin repeat